MISLRGKVKHSK